MFSKTDDVASIPADAVTTDFVVVVLFSDLVLMDIGDFRRYYKALWSLKPDCAEVPLYEGRAQHVPSPAHSLAS